MKTATRVAQLVLLGSGALLLVLGLIIWTGHGDRLIGIHALLGLVLVLSLWAIAATAARTGVSIGLVALAVAGGLAAPILGGVQDRLVTGGWHWTIQVLRLAVSMGVIAMGRLLVIRIRRNQAAAGSGRLPGQLASPAHGKDLGH
jgi:hypothetical protein